jgi:hypothetical protein
MLSTIEKDIFGSILDNAIQELSNNSCNDAPVSVEYVNKTDLIAFIHEYVKAAGYDEEDSADMTESMLQQVEEGEVYFTDFMLLEMLSKKLMTS